MKKIGWMWVGGVGFGRRVEGEKIEEVLECVEENKKEVEGVFDCREGGKMEVERENKVEDGSVE